MKVLFKNLHRHVHIVGMAAFLLPSSTTVLGSESSASLEEIVVTSRKRAESLQEVPVSVNVFSAKDLENMSVANLRDAAQFSPNMIFNDDGQMGSLSPVIFIRGIGQAAAREIFFDPGVGIYVDGVFVGRPIGLDMDLLDVERIEVLRGPQGTLYGKNTIGGAVNIVTAKPEDTFGGSVEMTVGRFDRLDGKATVNIPVIPGKLHTKITASSRTADGYGNRLDIQTGKKVDEMGDVDRQSGRAVIDWIATERLDISLSLSSVKVDEKSTARRAVAYNDNLPVGSLLNQFLPIPHGSTFLKGLGWYDSYATDGNKSMLDSQSGSLTINWDIGDISLKSITSYKDYEVRSYFDPDGSSNAIINSENNWDMEQFSQEFMINGQSFSDRLNWVAGIFYFSEKLKVAADTVVLDALWKNLGVDSGFIRRIENETDSYAAYVQGSYDLTESLSLTLGLRYTYEDKTLARQQIRLHTGIEFVPYGESSADFDSITPRIGLDYQWTDDVMVYASVANGFKSGGINGRSVESNDFLPFDEENAWTYELGIKSRWFDNRIQLNTTAFFTDYSDIQFIIVTSDPLTLQPITVIDNAGEAEIKGFEAELQMQLTEGLSVTAGVGYTDAQYTKLKAGVPITTDSKFPEVPRTMYVLAAEYTTPLAQLGTLTARADWNRRSKVYHDAANSQLIAQDSYGVVNARLSFETINGDWVVSTFVTNLTDEKYIQGGSDFMGSLGFAEATLSRPREWGASIRYNFN